MAFRFGYILWVVALYIVTVLSLPLGSSSLVARQDGNPQRQMFCHYNVRDCRQQFGWYCKEEYPPPWCYDDTPGGDDDELSIDSTSLVARQDGNHTSEPAHQMFCEQNAEFCRVLYPQQCKDGNDVVPEWCHVSSPSTEDPNDGDDDNDDYDNDNDVPSREEAREMYCKVNADYCRIIFSEDCKAGGENTPDWCHVRPSREEAREMYCKVNAAHCRIIFSEDCKAGKENVPEWCHVQKPPTEPPTESSDDDDKLALVARQDDNPARQLFCEKNAEYCQEHYPGYCKPGNDKIPSWCHVKSPPTSVSASGPALIARQESIETALDKRTPQDPDREEEEEEKEEQEQEQEKEEEKEEEKPHHFEKSWCKKHPHHPYCYSQFCIDNPGRCKKEPDGKMIKGDEDTQSLGKRDKKGGWYCFWLC